MGQRTESLSKLTVAIDARLIGGSSTGDSTYWTCLVQALAQAAPDIQLLLLSNKERSLEIPDYPNVSWLKIPTRSNRWWSLVAFPMAARRAGAQILHTQYALSPLAKGGITTIHDVSFFLGPEWFRARDRFLLQRTVPSSARRAKAVLTVSETSKVEILRYIGGINEKTHAIYNACPPWIRKQDRDTSRRRVTERFGIEGNYLLTIGTRWPRKNFSLAVEASSMLNEAWPHKLVVTGKVGWGEELQTPNSIYAGYVTNSDINDLYSASSAYLIPSQHEGFGIPMLEAWRCGTPVMCSMGGALPEIAGDAAIVEPTWSAADWAMDLEKLLSDTGTVQEMLRRGFARESTFSWERAARETLDVYRLVAP